MQLKIDAAEVKEFTKTLEYLSRSALPVAVRTALNSTAFDVKKNTMPTAAQTFVQRKPTFFKANSKVEGAKGFDIPGMQAVVGFVPKGGNDKAVDDLEQQETGGAIKGRSFIPLTHARTGGTWNRTVKSTLRMGTINHVVDANKETGKNKREKWNKAAIKAGVGGLVIGTTVTSKGNHILFRIKEIKTHEVRGGTYTFTKQTPLYAVRKGRIVTPKATHFMEKAAQESYKKMPDFYIAAANKQIQKAIQQNASKAAKNISKLV